MATLFLRGSILHFLRDPGAPADPGAWEYWDDGCLKVVDGRVAALGPADAILKARRRPAGESVHTVPRRD